MSFFKDAKDYDQKLTGKSLKPNRKGKIFTEETRAKVSAGKLGHKHSEETKAKIREGNLGKIVSAESRAKMRAAWVSRRQKGISAETRAKLSKPRGAYKYHCPYGTFDTAKEIEKVSGLHPHAIRRRCNSKSYPEWSRSEVKNLTK